ncbi:MAG: FAD-dependent oxidoreductase [Caldilineaceae bacterium]
MKPQPNKPTKVVVLGGGYAGMLAAIRLAGKVRQTNTQITLINGSAHFVERVRMHQLAANQTLKVRPIAQLLPKKNTNFCEGWVTRVDPQAQTVQVQTADGDRSIAYDYMIYAPGSATDMQGVPGVAEFAHDVGSAPAAARLQKALLAAQTHASRVLIVGGGLTGIEAATEIAETYPALQVTLATQSELGDALSYKGARYLRQVFGQLNIHFVEHARVTEVTAAQAQCADGRTLPFDVCVWAGSFRAPALAKASGLPTDSRGRVLIDETLRNPTFPNIYAVGDAAAAPVRMGCVTAMPMAAYAADHLAAQILGQAPVAPFGFKFLVRCISLGRRRGLVQFVEGDDATREKIITGWTAARIKELICRFTVWALHWEKRFPAAIFGRRKPGAHLN